MRASSLLTLIAIGACTAETPPPNLGNFDGSTTPAPGTGGVPLTDASVANDGGIVALAAASNPKGIALANGNVYYTNFGGGSSDGSVSVVSTTGTGAANLATGLDGPWALSLTAGTVFFSLAPTAGAGGLSSVSIGGGTPTPIQQNAFGVVGVANDGTNLFWTIDSGAGVTIATVPLAGGNGKSPNDVPGDIHPVALTLSGGSLFMATSGTQATIVATSASDTALIALDVQATVTFADVVASTTTIYATVDDVAPSGQIIAYPRGTGSPVTIATSLNHPQRLAIDGIHLYFTDPVGGNVWVKDVTVPDPPVIYASGLNAPLPVAIADALYVGDADAIVRIPKL